MEEEKTVFDKIFERVMSHFQPFINACTEFIQFKNLSHYPSDTKEELVEEFIAKVMEKGRDLIMKKYQTTFEEFVEKVERQVLNDLWKEESGLDGLGDVSYDFRKKLCEDHKIDYEELKKERGKERLKGVEEYVENSLREIMKGEK